MTAFAAGDDGRPDWMARKACNYITATIEDCTNQLVGDCATEEEVNDMKDGQMEGLLKQLSETIQEWDSEKCPAIKAYMDRNPAAEDEEVAASVDTADQEKETTEEGGDKKDSEKHVDAGDDDPADVEGTNSEEQTNEDGGGDNGAGDESNEEPESGSETAAASLSLVLVMYKICTA